MASAQDPRPSMGGSSLQPPPVSQQVTRAYGSFNDNSMKDYSTHVNHNVHGVVDNRTFSTVKQALRGLDILKEHRVEAASYDSLERQSEAPCLPGTRAGVLDEIYQWVDSGDDKAVYWLYGAGGSGKTTIATSVASKYAEENRLAGSFFFSRDPAHHAGRRSTRGVVATIAYQNGTSHSVPKSQIKRILSSDPTIVDKSFGIQFNRLIVGPYRDWTPWVLSAIQTFFDQCGLGISIGSRLPMVVVVDSLDECKEPVDSLIEVLAEYQGSPPPIRFLLTSRPEEAIDGKFCLYSDRTHSVDLMGFPALPDITAFLQAGFDKLNVQLREYLISEKKPWPSPDNISYLAEKSEGLFIYASTLLRYVEGEPNYNRDGQSESNPNRDGHPAKRLKMAMKLHDGLDGLYRQVLSDAPYSSDPKFMRILGALCFLRAPLDIKSLAILLRLDGPADIRDILRGSKSILRFPGQDDECITFYHASLHDFFTTEKRSQKYYALGVVQHMSLLDDSIQIIIKEQDRFRSVSDSSMPISPSDASFALRYALRNWHLHLLEVYHINGDYQGESVINLLRAHFDGTRYQGVFLYFLNLLGDATFDWRWMFPGGGPDLERQVSIDTGREIAVSVSFSSLFDYLYRRVLWEAPHSSDPKFKRIMGALCFLRSQLDIGSLATFLRLDGPAEIRRILTDCKSILRIPKTDPGGLISLLHISRHDFFTNKERSQEAYLDDTTQHLSLLDDSIQLIIKEQNAFLQTHSMPISPPTTSLALKYALMNWHLHLLEIYHLKGDQQGDKIINLLKGHFDGKRYEILFLHFLKSLQDPTWTWMFPEGGHDLQCQSSIDLGGEVVDSVFFSSLSDYLYRRVLREAPHSSDPKFKRIIGALCFLRNPLHIEPLAALLRLAGPADVRHILTGCNSILRIPKTDTAMVTFFHTSLHDFFTIEKRSQTDYIDDVAQHLSLLDDSIQIIMKEQDILRRPPASTSISPPPTSLALKYALRSWHLHLLEIYRLNGDRQGDKIINLLKGHFDGKRYESLFLHFLKSLQDPTGRWIFHDGGPDLQRHSSSDLGGEVASSASFSSLSDYLYHRVLIEAPHSSDPKFKQIIGALCFLRSPLDIESLATLLRFDGAAEVRHILTDYKSILRIPETDTGGITFLHSSLHDFFTNKERSQGAYLDDTTQHLSLLDDSIQLIIKEQDAFLFVQSMPIGPPPSSLALKYALMNWHFHLLEIYRLNVDQQGDRTIKLLMGYFDGQRYERLFLRFLKSMQDPNWSWMFPESGHDLQCQSSIDLGGEVVDSVFFSSLLDYLYRRVLREAPHFSDPRFKRIIGALCFLRSPLDIESLASLLRLNGPAELRYILTCCNSILRIPETDVAEVTFFHTSLQDFFTNEKRSQADYVDDVVQHLFLLDDSIQLIIKEQDIFRSAQCMSVSPPDASLALRYALTNWHLHLLGIYRVGGDHQGKSVINQIEKHFQGERYQHVFLSFLNLLGDVTFAWTSMFPRGGPDLERQLSTDLGREVAVSVSFSSLSDYLYRRVLREAPYSSDPRFKQIIGALCFLRSHLDIESLATLLRLDGPAEIRHLLTGCNPIFRILETDTAGITFLHTSLRDFFTNKDRSQGDCYTDKTTQHLSLLDDCVQIVMKEQHRFRSASDDMPISLIRREQMPALKYALESWPLHLLEIYHISAHHQGEGVVNLLKAHFDGERYEHVFLHFLHLLGDAAFDWTGWISCGFILLSLLSKLKKGIAELSAPLNRIRQVVHSHVGEPRGTVPF